MTLTWAQPPKQIEPNRTNDAACFARALLQRSSPRFAAAPRPSARGYMTPHPRRRCACYLFGVREVPDPPDNYQASHVLNATLSVIQPHRSNRGYWRLFRSVCPKRHIYVKFDTD